MNQVWNGCSNMAVPDLNFDVMKLLKNHAYIHGFEDYKILNLLDTVLTSKYDYRCPYSFDTCTQTYLIVRDMPIRVYNEVNPVYDWVKTVCFEPAVCKNHKELLATAKKVFTHPNCKLSRSMMAEKYKKSLNPWLSDAIIVPEMNTAGFDLEKRAVFINEDYKAIIMVELNSESILNNLSDFILGTKFSDHSVCDLETNGRYSVELVRGSELIYIGDVLTVPNEYSYVAELLLGKIPESKIVYEKSVQESLSNESNQLDFDSLCSIKDMLESSDSNTVSAGLKALSMMDWMHYTQSVKFILNNIITKGNWIYNNACNATSVKYMIRTISGDKAYRRSMWPGDYDTEIYEEDFELFKQLKCHYHYVQPEDVMNNIRAMSFIRVTVDGMLVPNLKTKKN